MSQTLQHKLAAISELAKASKWQRLWHAPFRYIRGQLFFRTTYRRTGKGWLVDAPTFFGTSMKVLLPAGMDVYLLGAKTHDSEIRLTKWLLHNLGNGQTVLDIGAHFGFYSLLAAHLVGPSGRVLSIEASPSVFVVCLENVSRQDNINLFQLAATNEEGSLSFYEYPVLYSEYNTLDPEQFADNYWIQHNPPKAVTVTGKRMDTVLAANDAIPDVIKIDVEGAEDKVIAGLSQTLQRYEPMVAMEFLTSGRSNEPHRRAAELLFDFGYVAYFIDAKGQLRTAGNTIDSLLTNPVESDNIIFKKL